MNIEVGAINTTGLWYGYIMVNNKIIWQNKDGYGDRFIAILKAKTTREVENERRKKFHASIFDNVD